MCTYLTEKIAVAGSGKGAAGLVLGHRRDRVSRSPPARAGRAHAQHRFPQPGQGPSARVAVELTADSARALARAIEATLKSAPPGLA